MNLYLKFLIINASAFVLGTYVHASDFCLEILNSKYVRANGVAVTGDHIYGIESVLTNLGINNAEYLTSLEDKKVLSIGEGYSGLLPQLKDFTAEMTAVDIWYHSNSYPDNESGKLMREYVEQHGRNLVQADAASAPFEGESFDLILSHMLVNNLDVFKNKDVVKEAIRILNRGGEIRIYGFPDSHKYAVEDLMKAEYPALQYAFTEIPFLAAFDGQRHFYDLNLLVIKKPL